MKNIHEIEIKLEGSEWTNLLDKAFKKKAKDVKVDGFRKGNVPKEVYIKKFGLESLYMDAVDEGVSIAFNKAMENNKDLIPVCEPKVDIKGISDTTVIFNFTIITKPEVKLGAYKNLKIKKESANVKKEEINEEIENLRTKFAEIIVKENGTIANGDTAVIDFDGLVDGKPLDGGKGANYPLEIGSNTFIPGFEEKLIGMKAGETKDIKLKFPSDYVDNLKDKDVVFTVKINEIKTRALPELNEDFFKDLGYDDVKDIDSLNKHVENDLLEKKEHSIEDQYIESVMEKASENMSVEINEEILDDEIHRMMHQFEEQLKSQGLNMEQYYEFTKTTHEDMHKNMEGEATKRVKYRFLLEAIADKENIEVSSDEAEKDAVEQSEKYQMTKDDYINALGGLEIVKYDLKMKKAIEFLKNN